MPTVFITGATGFIGRALCVRMLDSGWRVLGAWRKNVSRANLPARVEGVQIETIENYNDDTGALKGVDTIIHLAARAHVMNDGLSSSLDIFRRINVVGTQRLAYAAARAGVKKFIFISSIKVNGESSPVPYTENDLPAPEDAYGISKYEAEQALAVIAAETGLKTVIIRPPLVYGPGVKANFENLIKLAASGLPLPFKSIHNRRSFIYLGNLIDAIFTGVINPKAEGETFLVNDGQDISTPDLIKMLAAALDKKVALFPLHSAILNGLFKIVGKSDELEKLTGSLFVDSSKIRNLLGWKPPFTLKEGIKETIKYYK